MKEKTPRLTCCADMVQAQKAGTDNEGYGALVFYAGGFMMGTLRDIEFCPWCGTPVKLVTP